MAAAGVSFRHFILGLLNQQPMSGYDIKLYLKDLGWLIDGPSFGNIYATLHGLLKEQLVTVEVAMQENKPPRKEYHITAAGRQVLREWVNLPLRGDASLKTFVMRLIVAGSLSPRGLMDQLRARIGQLNAFQAALADANDGHTGAFDPQDGSDTLRDLAIDYGRALAVAELDWLNQTLGRLSDQPLSLEVVQGD
jgi:DNA-binding PadR family transcriptional regulator